MPAPEPIEFAKLSGSGNDHICLDNRDGRFDPILADPSRIAWFVSSLCHRGTGVGADGVIFAAQAHVGPHADIAARFFDADGSEAELCGNGTGCFVRWAFSRGWVPAGQTKVLTPAGVVLGQCVDDRYVRVCVTLPEDLRRDLTIRAGGRDFSCDYVITGVPHVVTYVDDVNEVDVARFGPALRRHELFQPRGANANFVQVLGEGEIALRTFEFGVEGETLACGTGSASAALLTALRHGWGPPYTNGQEYVQVHVRSGDVIKVLFAIDAIGQVTDFCIETHVRFVYTGTVHPDLAVRALAGERASGEVPAE